MKSRRSKNATRTAMSSAVQDIDPVARARHGVISIDYLDFAKKKAQTVVCLATLPTAVVGVCLRALRADGPGSSVR
jgi:hypothetical protein